MHSASFSQNYWTLNDIKEFTDELSIGQSKTTILNISKFGSIFTYSRALHNIVYESPKMVGTLLRLKQLFTVILWKKF